MKARIVKSGKKELTCYLNNTNVSATCRSNVLKDCKPVVGDHVELSFENESYIIEKVYERKNEIFRNIIRENKKKVTAANLDVLAIVTSCHKPKYKRGIIDRFLVRAYQWNIPPLIIFNKIDLLNESKMSIEFEIDRLKELGIETFKINSKEKSGDIDQLQDHLKNKTAIFLGQSGVGKSKLITALSNQKVELISSQIGKMGKGAHTTTWSELIMLPKFNLIDSPGIRSFSVDDIREKDLISFFPDLLKYSKNCKFPDCKHREKDKACYFHTLKTQENYSKINSRLEAYQAMREETEKTPEWEKD